MSARYADLKSQPDEIVKRRRLRDLYERKSWSDRFGQRITTLLLLIKEGAGQGCMSTWQSRGQRGPFDVLRQVIRHQSFGDNENLCSCSGSEVFVW